MDSARVFYRITPNDPGAGIFKVVATFPPSSSSHFSFQFAHWRPGRYFQGNFLKNLRHIEFFIPEETQPLGPEQIRRTEALGWEIFLENKSGLEVHYTFMAHELNAGTSYCNPDFIQINPVNLCVASLHHLHLPHAYHMEKVADVPMANPLQEKDQWFEAADFDRLSDAPAWWHKALTTSPFSVNGHDFFLHHTSGQKDFSDKLIPALSAIIQTQLAVFEHYDQVPFHFMVLATTYPSHHGVEHTHSTICQIGPDEQLLTEKWDELLRLLSHEFYHVWNIKYIRPKAYLPYPLFSQKISPETLWAEGVTTYMGDKIIAQSGLWSPEEWMQKIQNWWIRHVESPGNAFASLIHSAEETWVDGYEPERIFRRKSIYVEGALLSFWLDVQLVHASHGAISLQTLMGRLHQKSMQGIGYNLEDIWVEIAHMGFPELSKRTKELMHQNGFMHAHIEEALHLLGIDCTWQSTEASWTKAFGALTGISGRVLHVREQSPAMDLGLMVGDEWMGGPSLALNAEQVPEQLTFLRQGITMEVIWPLQGRPAWKIPQLQISHLGSHPIFKAWLTAF
jgi:predicted metalloprotease with PDZ domain